MILIMGSNDLHPPCGAGTLFRLLASRALTQLQVAFYQ